MSTPYVGEIRMFAFPRIPTGWFACDGSLKSIADYEVLYTLLGTTYGGNGVQTFGLPDLRGQVPLHNGTGPGRTTRVIGQSGGTENVSLLSTQNPQHNHAYMATTTAGTAAAPGPTVVLGSVAPADTMYLKDITGAAAEVLPALAVGAQGASVPHDNCMPTLTVSYCIAWAGIFPTRN
jgi:microcystin-dependent protein